MRIHAWLGILLLAVSMECLGENSGREGQWPAWDTFAERFVQGDGRVIDLTFDGKSTSEGQSYGLFFALVANQPAKFQSILDWTSNNLADGQLGEKLPGWLWGKRDDGVWGIKDRNAASDADLWIAYALLEAGRLWSRPEYAALGKKMLRLIAEAEVVDAGRAGKLLLPAPVGFELASHRYRINPSYLPGFQFKYLSQTDPKGPWADIWTSHMRLAPKIFAAGVAPDNLVVDAKGMTMPDTERAPYGSYDAIRVYMWVGMGASVLEDDKTLLRLLAPYAKLTRSLGQPPERVDPSTGKILKADYSPIGFSGALLPFLSALGEEDLLAEQRSRLRKDALQAKFGRATHYFDQALILFGQGWADGYYRFDAQGQLLPKWKF